MSLKIPEISSIVTNWSIMSSHAIPKSVERFWIRFLKAFKSRETFFIIIAFWVHFKGSVHFEAKFKAGNSQIITALRELWITISQRDNRDCCKLHLALLSQTPENLECVQHFLLVVFMHSQKMSFVSRKYCRTIHLTFVILCLHTCLSTHQELSVVARK